MRTFLRRLVVALVAVSALAWPPSRRLIADVLLTVAMHLEHADNPPRPTPEQRARMHDRFVADLADALVRRGREPAPSTARNGERPASPV